MAATRRYRGTSPFPLAMLELQRGQLWMEHDDLRRAAPGAAAAVRRLPAYVPAQGHLAELDAALGETAAAIDRLRPLALRIRRSRAYATQLARVLGDDRPAPKNWRRRPGVARRRPATTNSSPVTTMRSPITPPRLWLHRRWRSQRRPPARAAEPLSAPDPSCPRPRAHRGRPPAGPRGIVTQTALNKSPRLAKRNPAFPIDVAPARDG